MSFLKKLAIAITLLLVGAFVFFSHEQTAEQQTLLTFSAPKKVPYVSKEIEAKEMFVVSEIPVAKKAATKKIAAISPKIVEALIVTEIPSEIEEATPLVLEKRIETPDIVFAEIEELEVEEALLVGEIRSAQRAAPPPAAVQEIVEESLEVEEAFVVAEIHRRQKQEPVQVKPLTVKPKAPEVFDPEESFVVAEIEAPKSQLPQIIPEIAREELAVISEQPVAEEPLALEEIELEDAFVVEVTTEKTAPEEFLAKEAFVVAEIELTPEIATEIEPQEALAVAEIEMPQQLVVEQSAPVEESIALIPEVLEAEDAFLISHIDSQERKALAVKKIEIPIEVKVPEPAIFEAEEALVVIENAYEGAVLALEEALIPNETSTLQALAADLDESLTAPREGCCVGLRGIVLIPDRDAMLDPDALENVEGVYLNGVTLPGNYAHLLCRLKPLYEGKSIQFEVIQEIKREIALFYEQNHVPFVLVAVPQQKISHQVLQLVVMRSMLGQIIFEGNNWFSDGMLQRYVKAAPEKEIDVVSLQRDMNAMNRNPFRRCNLVYAPGECFGTTNLIVSTEDRFPLRIYVGTDNTGVESTGRERAISGISVGRLFGLDHVANYQYTASFDFSSFQGHTLQYIAPLPWKNHFLNLYGGFSTVKPTLPTPTYRTTGENKQLSARYVMPLPSPVLHQQEVSLGFDYKLTNNTVLFSDLIDNFSSKVVNLSQFVGEYKRNDEWKHNRIDVDLKLVWSPGDILANESNERYEQLRDHAKNSWIYALGSFRYLYRNSHRFEYSLWLRGQISTASLLPSEQLGIGGYDTVRGYDERQLNMDNGVLANFELRAPVMPLFQTFYPRKIKDGLQLLVFADGGWGVNNTKYDGEPTNDYLVGAGPGVRYTLEPYITLRADWGIKLHHQAFDTGNKLGEIHFSFTAGY